MDRDFSETMEAYHSVANAINSLSSDLKEIDSVDELAKIDVAESAKQPTLQNSDNIATER